MITLFNNLSLRVFALLLTTFLFLIIGCEERTIEPNQNNNSGGNCSNTCQYAYDGECDDGGPGSLYDLCPCNTDCADCGARSNGCNGSGTSGNGGTSNGQAMFWISSDLGCGNISVSLNGTSRSISSFYSSGTPGCGASGCATFTLAPGTYSYTASCSGYSWTGRTVTVSSNGCSTIQLTL